MTAKQVIDDEAIPKEQLNLIEHFVAGFNTVEHFLRKALATNKYVPFSSLVTEYSRKHAGWGDADLLRTIAGVRNAIIHGKTESLPIRCHTNLRTCPEIEGVSRSADKSTRRHSDISTQGRDCAHSGSSSAGIEDHQATRLFTVPSLRG